MGFDLYTFIDLLVILVGLYALLQWRGLRKDGKLNDSRLIYPSGASAKNCRDPEGYYDYITPKLMTFGMMSLGSGVIAVAADVLRLHWAVSFLANLLFLGYMIWYGCCISAGWKRFFR